MFSDEIKKFPLHWHLWWQLHLKEIQNSLILAFTLFFWKVISRFYVDFRALFSHFCKEFSYYWSGARPFKCDSCPKAFARAHQLAVHQPVHTGERAHLCSECGNAFSSVSSLIDHRKRSHLKLREHKCHECVKEFFTKTELAAHVRTHTGDKPFQCGVSLWFTISKMFYFML